MFLIKAHVDTYCAHPKGVGYCIVTNLACALDSNSGPSSSKGRLPEKAGEGRTAYNNESSERTHRTHRNQVFDVFETIPF